MEKGKIEKGFYIYQNIKEIDLGVHSLISGELRDVDLTPQQLTIIRYLGHHKEMTVGEICSVMGLTKGTVSGILNRMEKLLYVEKKKDESDKRNTYISLTELGKDIGREYMMCFNKVLGNIFKEIDDEKLDEIKENLNIITQKIKESGGLCQNY